MPMNAKEARDITEAVQAKRHKEALRDLPEKLERIYSDIKEAAEAGYSSIYIDWSEWEPGKAVADALRGQGYSLEFPGYPHGYISWSEDE